MAHLSCVGETARGPARRSSTGSRDAGIENVLALRGDPPRGRGGLRPARRRARQRRRADRASSASAYGLRDRRRLLPRGPPRGRPSLEADLAYLKTKVDAGASFLITQLFFDNRRLLRLRRRAARAAGIDVPIIPGVMPITSFAPDRSGSASSATRRSRRRSTTRDARRSAATSEAEFELGVAYAAQQCAELLARRRPGHPLLRAQPLAGDARDPRRAAGLAGRGSEPALRRARGRRAT